MPVPRQYSKAQKSFIILFIFVCILLFYANGVAFNLFSATTFNIDIIAYSALAVAVTLTVVIMAIVFRDMRNGVFPKTQDSDVVSAIKESERTTCTVPLPANTQENINKTKPKPEDLQASITQKSQPFKQLTTQRTKVICPACRKEFSLPSYQKEFIVDFGPPESSNLIKTCPYCEASIPLKQENA